MKKNFRAMVAVCLLAGPVIPAQAGEFTCITGTFSDCALAESSLSWTWNGLDFTIANTGIGYVSEVYFDMSSGMAASFFGGTGGTVNFVAGANPAALPGGNSVGFVSVASFDADAGGVQHWGIDSGETGTFRIVGATLGSFDAGTLEAGLHVRSFINGSTSLVTAPTQVPEPGSLALFGLGLAALGLAMRRRRKTTPLQFVA